MVRFIMKNKVTIEYLCLIFPSDLINEYMKTHPFEYPTLEPGYKMATELNLNY